MKYLSLILLLSIALVAPIVQGENEKAESRHDKIYYFQHKVLPAILFESDGVVFADLKNGSNSKVIGIAKDVVDNDFAKAMVIKPVPNRDAYTVTFQKPAEPPECYYAFILKKGDDCLYYTLERGIDLFGTGAPRVLCQWEKGGKHMNYGSREYDDLKSFIKDVLTMQKDG